MPGFGDSSHFKGFPVMDELTPVDRRIVLLDFKSDRFGDEMLATAFRLPADFEMQSPRPQSSVQNRDCDENTKTLFTEVLDDERIHSRGVIRPS